MVENNNIEIEKEFEVNYSKVKYFEEERKPVHCVLTRVLSNGTPLFFNGSIKERHADFFTMVDLSGNEHIVFYLEIFKIEEYKEKENGKLL